MFICVYVYMFIKIKKNELINIKNKFININTNLYGDLKGFLYNFYYFSYKIHI